MSHKVNRLALGTVQFGLPYGIANSRGKVTQAEAAAMLGLAFKSGIHYLDTAIAYGDSEACLGAIGIDDFRIITKLPSVPEGCSDIFKWAQDQLSASLVRLGLKATYGLILHRPDQLLGRDGAILYRALHRLKDAGKTDTIGISIYSPDELDALNKSYKFDLVQAPFSLLDKRLHSSGWLHRLKDSGVEIHTRSTFLQGLLLMNRAALPGKFARWSSIFDEWHNWLSCQNVPALEAALSFPLSFPEIDRVVVGADNIGQLSEIIRASNYHGICSLPNFEALDENLINPSRWSNL